MNLNQLEYFCAAVECGSITKAAKKLFVTQPAISGAIRELEKEFSVTLFSHTRSKLSLSADGERFYERAERLLREVETAKMQLHDLGGSRQPVSVGIPPLWGTTFFPDLLLTHLSNIGFSQKILHRFLVQILDDTVSFSHYFVK